VLATGESHTVREFVELAFAHVGVTLDWRGAGVDEIGSDARTGQVLVQIDPRYFRPTEVDFLLGDASKARAKFGWTHQTDFAELIREMVENDLVVMRTEGMRNEQACE
jgi:GDPmannose 4,6-dehydratase